MTSSVQNRQIHCWRRGSAWRTWLWHQKYRAREIDGVAVSCKLVTDNNFLKSDPFTWSPQPTKVLSLTICCFVTTFRKHVRDVNVIPGKEIAKQHHLLVYDFRADIPLSAEKKSVPQGKMEMLEKPGWTSVVKRNIRRPSASPNMLFVKILGLARNSRGPITP